MKKTIKGCNNWDEIVVRLPIMSLVFLSCFLVTPDDLPGLLVLLHL